MKDKYQKLCDEAFYKEADKTIYEMIENPNPKKRNEYRVWEILWESHVIPLLECVQFYSERHHFYPGTSDQSVKIYEEKYIDGKYEGDTFLCEKARQVLKDLGVSVDG